MTEDRYALELERAIFNWYYGGDNCGLPRKTQKIVRQNAKNPL